jgi:hypothetical protein
VNLEQRNTELITGLPHHADDDMIEKFCAESENGQLEEDEEYDEDGGYVEHHVDRDPKHEPRRPRKHLSWSKLDMNKHRERETFAYLSEDVLVRELGRKRWWPKLL